MTDIEPAIDADEVTGEIVVHEPQQGVPDEIATLWRVAQRVAPTEFVPRPFRGKPEAVMACILSGREVGLQPMQSLQLIHVIDGRPTLSAQAMRAVVLAAGHDIWVDDTSSDKTATVHGIRKGDTVQRSVTWTWEQATAAKLTAKDNWKNYPRQMLVARATTELCRELFADAVGGLCYEPSELEDGYRAELGSGVDSRGQHVGPRACCGGGPGEVEHHPGREA